MGEEARRRRAGTYPSPTTSNESAVRQRYQDDIKMGMHLGGRTVRPPESPDAWMLLGGNSLFSQGLKADISRVVTTIDFRGGTPGGHCIWRTWIGAEVLKMLGFRPEIKVGGLLYRAGPDPYRDCLSFCGKGNTGQLWHGHFLGHTWLSLEDEAIDFSCEAWRKEATAAAEVGIPDAMTKVDQHLGPIMWARRPPDLIWAPEDLLTAPWRREGSPEIGNVWLCPWEGEQPTDTLIAARDIAAPFRAILQEGIKANRLPERIEALFRGSPWPVDRT